MDKVTIELDAPYKKQREFFEATSRFVAYGGARGGGKSWAARVKLILLALGHDGIQLLLVRRTLPQLRENHIITLQKMLKNTAVYREVSKEFMFPNGSRLKLGYCDSEQDVLQYQGQAYDVIFMEEATQFTEFQFQAFTECNRASGMMREKFSPRMYLTCNPGGVGHSWVKRLFIDRDYRGSECSDDYTFIKSLVYDNEYLMKNSPEYVRVLENLPEARKRAMLYGEWELFEGQYFSEFCREVHVIEPFVIPKHWRRYVSLDYGLDMLACYWIAMDTVGNAFVYRELYEPSLIISRAAEKILTFNEGDDIEQYFAPPDLWNRRQDTGKSAVEIFAENGILLTKASNDRAAGWLNLKEWLKVYGEKGERTSRLKFFRSCVNIIRCLPAIRFDEKNPNDCAVTPHEITHSCDAMRYFASARPASSDVEVKKEDGYIPECEQEWELAMYGV